MSAAPSLSFVGPALGHHDGWVTTQGEVLADLFRRDGVAVRQSSHRIHPIGRAIDHAVDLVRWRGEVDVAVISVFSGRGFALADEALLVARALRIPSVAWLHGGNLPEFGAAHPRWARRALRLADAVVSPTAYLDRWAADLVPDRVVVPNVLDLDRSVFRVRDHPTPRLLWMRTFQELYDPATAVRVLAALRASGVPATLTMAGQDKGALAETQALARTLAVDEWIAFPGFASAEDKADLFDAHDVFVNTNVVDNAPVTVLEAAASGLAIVSTDVGGLPDLVPDGVGALLVPTASPDLMATAVTRVLREPGLAAELGTNARRIAERSAWPAVREQWLDLFASLGVNRGGRAGPGSPPP